MRWCVTWPDVHQCFEAQDQWVTRVGLFTGLGLVSSCLPAPAARARLLAPAQSLPVCICDSRLGLSYGRSNSHLLVPLNKGRSGRQPGSGRAPELI